MAATSIIKFTNIFEDGTTADIQVGEISPQKMPADLKEKVKEFNAAMDGSQYPQMLVSKTGALWKRIDAVEIITTSRTYIF